MAPNEGRQFHNRLTHSLKVAQIGRRIAENLLRSDRQLVEEYGGLDPDVVEVAALCHDLGHPPFGHITEKTLDKLLVRKGLEAGYEGNAQSFRIVCKLAVRRESHPGLNLTRASLNAILKYPWQRAEKGKESKKWGAYPSEARELEFARELMPSDRSDQKSLEADIMDWADDIAYSVHDLEDFYRAGLVPLQDLIQSSRTRDEFLERTKERWLKKQEIKNEDELAPYGSAFHAFVGELPPITGAYRGTREQRSRLRNMTSASIGRFIAGTKLRPRSESGEPLEIDATLRNEVAMLKQLTWDYVILNPALATQQHGKKRVIEDLVDVYCSAIEADNIEIFPERIQEEFREHGTEPMRLVADTVSSFSDQEAFMTHGRLTGRRPGSIVDQMPF